MVRSGICTSAFGIKAPIIKEGDNIVDAVIDSVFNATRIHKTTIKHNIGNILYNPGTGDSTLTFSLNMNFIGAITPGAITIGPILC